jgi:oligogalacturonide lyase
MARSDQRLGSRSPQAALRREPSLTRRAFTGLLAIPVLSRQKLFADKGRIFPTEAVRYTDASTELEVDRLTSPTVSSFLPAQWQRAVAHRGGFMVYSSDRAGSLQVFRMDLKSGEMHQLTDAAALDSASVTLLPGDRSFCYFDGPSLREGMGRDRVIYRIPEGWQRGNGFTLSDDGINAALVEKRNGKSRLRLVSLLKGAATTVLESDGEIATPMLRPKRAQILYQRDGLWLVNLDGRQNRRLKTESNGPVLWTPSGRTFVYLHFPESTHELNTLREHTPDENADRLLAKTSQFAAFGCNADASVFVGASRNKASPTILLLLRAARREFTLCEHKASDPAATWPVFSPDSQNILFQSDREGKSALYRMRVNKLVEETEITADSVL